MATDISNQTIQCLKAFAAIVSSGFLERYEAQVSKRRWLDELGRLRIWTGNIGAHQTGQSSLDYRLRDSSHLKGETDKTLQRLLSVLQEICTLVEESSEDFQDVAALEDYSVNSRDESIDEGDLDDSTYCQALFESLRNNVDLLFQISMAIRKPADHDRLLGTKINNLFFVEPWTQRHVRQKFPGADPIIIERLGAAMVRQEAILKYRQHYGMKLRQGLPDKRMSTMPSDTAAAKPVMEDSADELDLLETSSISEASQSSYAPSLFTSQDLLTIPSPPESSANESPFECPYCFHIIKIRNNKDWAQHIFKDLMPYVCVVPQCSTPSKHYESRRQWFEHVYEYHQDFIRAERGIIQCCLCRTDIESPKTYSRHVGHHLQQLGLSMLPGSYLEIDSEYLPKPTSITGEEAPRDSESDCPESDSDEFNIGSSKMSEAPARAESSASHSDIEEHYRGMFNREDSMTANPRIISNLDPTIDLVDASGGGGAGLYHAMCCQCASLINTALSSRCVYCQHEKCDNCMIPPL